MLDTRTTYLTHATWSPTQCDPEGDVADNWTVRYVKVTSSDVGVAYEQELVERVPHQNADGACMYKSL